MEETKRIPRSIITSAWSTLHGIHLVLLVVDVVVKKYTIVEYLVKEFQKMKQNENIPVVLVLNKSDIATPRGIHLVADQLNSVPLFEETFVLSAQTGDGVSDLKEYLIHQAKPNNWMFSAETKSELSDVERITEIIREKLFCNLRQELPYTIKQSNRGWTESVNGTLKILQDIIVLRNSQRKIVIGKRSQVIKKIQSEATEDIEKLLKKKIFLSLAVRVDKSKNNQDLRL